MSEEPALNIERFDQADRVRGVENAADEENRAPFQVAEDFSRQLDGGVADRYGPLGQRSL